MEDALELVMTPTLGAAGVRVRLVKRITSIGSAPDADLRFHSLPAQWATVQRDGGGATVQVRGGEPLRLAPGERITVDGMAVELGVPRGLGDRAIDALASRLAAAESPDEALVALLDGAIAASGADLGAIVLVDAGAGRSETSAGWTVAAARDAAAAPLASAGAPLADAAALLGGSSLREVLERGEHVLTPDGTRLWLPLRLDGRTLGAVLLGAHQRRTAFDERAADLRLLTALAVPFVAQLRRHALAAPFAPVVDPLVGDSPAIEQVRRLIRRIAPSGSSVLVVGAPGSGKALVARAIHAASARAAGPLITIHCAPLLDAELIAAAETAQGSTLFLDEVGDLPSLTQAALVRILAAGTLDLRLVAATHRDLVVDVATGRFREDLLLRLQEMRIDVPPLRDRGDDILLLARLFLRQAEAHLSLPAHALAPDAADLLLRYPWPGNVRELAAIMRRAAILADHAALTAADLPLLVPALPPPPIPRPLTPPMGTVAPPVPAPGGSTDLGDTSRALADARDDFVRRYVAAVLDRCAGNREAAARQLDIGVRTLYRYLG